MSVIRRIRRERVMRLAIAGSAAALLGACKDSGLPGKNLPQTQARTMEYRYAVYQALPESEALYQVDGRRWQVTGGVESMPENMLQQVGAAGGVTLHALSWDKAPYDRLYTARPDGKLAVVVPLD